MPFPSSGRRGAFVSATRTSPFGSTYSQRGWSSPLANARTLKPSAGVGAASGDQPFRARTFITGMSACSWGRSTGWVPVTAETGSLAGVPQASAETERMMSRGKQFIMLCRRGKNHASDRSAIGFTPPRGADGSKLAVSVCELVVFVQLSTNSRGVLSEGRPVP